MNLSTALDYAISWQVGVNVTLLYLLVKNLMEMI